MCIGLVLTAELFNSAVETLFRGLDEPTRERAWPALDIAAGAVLLASVFAAAVGVPATLPAEASSDRPAGNVPLATDQVYGAVPPDALSVAE